MVLGTRCLKYWEFLGKPLLVLTWGGGGDCIAVGGLYEVKRANLAASRDYLFSNITHYTEVRQATWGRVWQIRGLRMCSQLHFVFSRL